MRERKGTLSAGKIIVIAIIMIILVGVAFYLVNNFSKSIDKGVEQDIGDLTSDHLDEAFTEIEEVD